MKKKEEFEGQKMLVLHKKTLKKLRNNHFTSSLYVTDIGYFPKALYHFREREDGCLENILIFCLSGCGWVEIDGKRNYLTKNQYTIIPKSQPHRYGADHSDPWTIYWIHFAGDKTDHFIYPLDYPRELTNNIHSQFDDRANLFEEIHYILEEGHSSDNLEYCSVLLTNLLGSFKYLSLFKKGREVHAQDAISKSIIFMKDNLTKKMAVEELAASCELSVSHFCLLFKKKTSHTPIEHFTFLKMQRACHLLNFSSMRIKEIADSIGYDDAYYFTRVFKKVMGKSPTRYREIDS